MIYHQTYVVLILKQVHNDNINIYVFYYSLIPSLFLLQMHCFFSHFRFFS